MMFDKEQVRESFDLVKYASHYADLKSRGGKWSACCPLHNEKTASFHIHEDGEQWYCQGCGAGGDSFAFVGIINNLDIVSDFQKICEIMGGVEYDIEPFEKAKRKETAKSIKSKMATEEQMKSVFFDGEKYMLKKAYKYADNLLKCRYETENNRSKTFRWFWADETKQWFFGKGDISHGLYWALPKGTSKPTTGTVFVAEGEKAACAVAMCGFVCVTISDGADEKATKWGANDTQELSGFDVYILNDDDCNKDVNRGKLFADSVAFKIQDVVKSVTRIDINDVLDNEHKVNGYDIADVVEEIGTLQTSNILTELTFIEDPTVQFEMIKSRLGSSNEEVVGVVANAVNEIMTLGEIGFDTAEEIGKIGRKSGIGKKALTTKINELVDERKRNLSREVTVVSGTELGTIAFNDKVYDISGTGFSCEFGQIVNEKTKEIILTHICLYGGVVYDVEDNTCRDLLLFNTVKNPNSVNFVTVSADDIRSSQRLTGALSPHGIDITSAHSQDFVEFLRQMRNKQGTDMVEIKEINRIGWYDNFLLPYESEKAGVMIREKNNEHEIATAYASTKGDKEKSLNMIREVIENIDIAPVILGTMVSSLFVERIGKGGQTHVLNVSGTSGKGKTVLIKMLFSIFGDSANGNKMFGGSDATLQSGQNTAGYLHSFPLYLDDPLQAGREDTRSAQQRIYNLVSGSGRQRLDRAGNSRKSKEWFSNILYTNESPLYSSDENLKGGVLSRILDVELKKEIKQEDINRWLVDIAQEHYGHFGVDFANAIRKLDVNTIKDMLKEEYDVLFGVGVDRKRGNTAAVIAVGFKIACEVFGIEKGFPYGVILENVRKAGEICDGARGYKVFAAWLDGNMEKFRNVVDRNGALWGALDYHNERKVVNVQIDKLKEICLQLGIPRDTTVVHCAENNLVVVTGGSPVVRAVAGNDTISVVSFYCDWNYPQNNDYRFPDKGDEYDIAY